MIEARIEGREMLLLLCAEPRDIGSGQPFPSICDRTWGATTPNICCALSLVDVPLVLSLAPSPNFMTHDLRPSKGHHVCRAFG